MILTGIISNIFPEEVISVRFRKTCLWLTEVNMQYPQTWEITFLNDDGKWLAKYATGQLVNVNVALLGKLVQKDGKERIYNTIRGIKIERVK